LPAPLPSFWEHWRHRHPLRRICASQSVPLEVLKGSKNSRSRRKRSRYLISLMSFAVKGDLESGAPLLVTRPCPALITIPHLELFVICCSLLSFGSTLDLASF
jgi:hypothetical protein